MEHHSFNLFQNLPHLWSLFFPSIFGGQSSSSSRPLPSRVLSLSESKGSQEWWCRPIIPAIRKLREEGYKAEARLSNSVSKEN